MTGRCKCLLFAVYNVYVDEQLVALLYRLVDVCLSYSEPYLTCLAALCVRNCCTLCIYNVTVLHNLVYNVELVEVCEVVLVLECYGNDTAVELGVYLRH